MLEYILGFIHDALHTHTHRQDGAMTAEIEGFKVFLRIHVMSALTHARTQRVPWAQASQSTRACASW
jgi:hypothetical protein